MGGEGGVFFLGEVVLVWFVFGELCGFLFPFPFFFFFGSSFFRKLASPLWGGSTFVFSFLGGGDQKSTINLPFSEADMILFAYQRVHAKGTC